LILPWKTPLYRSINKYPNAIRSSLLLGSFPLNAYAEIYFMVPLINPLFLGSICFPVLEERYFLHNPKSIIYITFGSSFPIKKFCGFISLYIKHLE